MKKITSIAALALVTVGMATPAFADNDDTLSSGVNAATNWAFSAPDVCAQELAVVPALGDWAGDHSGNCSTGNVVAPATK
ncbi:hypothetical protein [Streptomyces phaeochromogenes]|uniref:hypothetical protein n=1 Tax=Streptomyces phaeochromogenes TaxID=1923 RepID=UPI003722D17B